MTLRVHASVLERMREEARRYSIETGGLVLGPNESTITTLIPSGVSAHRTYTSFELDADDLQPKVEAAIRRGLYFHGVWHVHPDGYQELSATDMRTAREMLSDPSYNLKRVILPLTVRHRGELWTRFFTVERRNSCFSEVPVTVIHGEKMTSIRDTDARGNGLTVDRQIVIRRLTAERAQLEADGWLVAIREHEELKAVRVERDDVSIWAVLPVEYPLNPPDLFSESRNGLVPITHHDVPEITIWSSARSLPIAIAQAAHAVRAEREAERLFRPRKFRNFVSLAINSIRSTAP